MTATEIFHLGLMAELNDAVNEEDAPEVDFFHRVIEAGDGPALDAGCGIGRLLRRCLAAGLDVEGSDISPDMLAICRRRCAAVGLEPTLHQAATAELELPRRYGTIVMSGSFGLNGTRADDAGSLRRIHRHLVPGGLLAFDIEPGWVDPRWPLLSDPSGLPTPWREGGPTPTRDGDAIVGDVRDVAVDRVEQSFTRDVRLHLLRDGVAQKTEVHRIVSRWYGILELVALLEAAGFVDVDWAEEPLHGRETMLVYQARRP